MIDSSMIIAGGTAVAGVVTAGAAFVNGWIGRRDRVDETDERRLRLYDEWAPKVWRWAATVQKQWAKKNHDEELPPFPDLPEPEEHRRRKDRR